MTKIIIVDYSLEIVIAIINDYFEQIYAIVWSCMPYFYIKYIFKKRLKTHFLNFYCFSIALSLKCQLYIGLVSSLNKKRLNYAWYNDVILKLKEKEKWFTKAIYLIYN